MLNETRGGSCPKLGLRERRERPAERYADAVQQFVDFYQLFFQEHLSPKLVYLLQDSDLLNHPSSCVNYSFGASRESEHIHEMHYTTKRGVKRTKSEDDAAGGTLRNEPCCHHAATARGRMLQNHAFSVVICRKA
jgi:hypothetical protein